MLKTGTRASAASIAGLFMLTILASMAAAQGTPSGPMDITGTATINGRAVPSGSLITAEVQGVIRGSVTVSEDGVIGTSGISDKLFIENAPYGGEISFYVQTPEMANRIKAAETASFRLGDSLSIDLTFTGDEIPRSSASVDTGGSSGGGSGGSGSSVTGGSEEPEASVPEPYPGAVISVDLTGSKTQDVEAMNKDTLSIMLPGGTYAVLLKSMSDFSVLFETGGKTFTVGLDESREADLNGDFVTDAEFAITDIKGGTAYLTLTRLDKSPVEASAEGLTGMIIANPVGFAIIFIIIAALGGVALKFSRRGSR